MKKRKPARARQYSSADEQTQEYDDMSDTQVEQREAPPPAPVDRAQPARDVSSGYSGMVAVRGHIDKSVPVNAPYIIARLPAGAVVFGGGLWVSEAFDGATLEVGHGDDYNTYISASLDAVGFTPLSLKEAAAPQEGVVQILAKVEAGELTKGKADLIIVYA